MSREVAAARYRARETDRHAGHLGNRRPPSELWNGDLLTPLDVGPVVRVDTTSPVQVDRVAVDIERALNG